MTLPFASAARLVLVTLAMLALSAGAARAATPILASAPGSPEWKLAEQFAPLVVLAKGEPYLPSSVEFFAPNVTLRCTGAIKASGSVLDIKGTLPDGNTQINNCNLTTLTNLKGPSDILPFFHGQDPNKARVPVYISFYRPDNDANALNIQYLTFYPYNWGKNVCLSLAPKDHCFAKRHQMDNHVGDWEGMSIQIENGKVTKVRVGAHSTDSIGFTYTSAGKGCPNEGGSGDLNKTGALSCLQWRGGHPIVYSAWGSHGIWGVPGNHTYNTLPTGERLNDATTKGIEWRTWEQLAAFDQSKYPFKYLGRWGNSHTTSPSNHNACKLSPVPKKLCSPAGIPTDEYELNDGPSTPPPDRDRSKLQ